MLLACNKRFVRKSDTSTCFGGASRSNCIEDTSHIMDHTKFHAVKLKSTGRLHGFKVQSAQSRIEHALLQGIVTFPISD